MTYKEGSRRKPRTCVHFFTGLWTVWNITRSGSRAFSSVNFNFPACCLVKQSLRVLHSRSDHTTKEKMPRDGTVFQLTSNVILFLEQLLDFVETVASILQQDSSYNQVNSARVSRLHAKNLFGSSGFHFLYIFLSTWYLVRKIRFRCSTFTVTLSICV